jgi:hypothetical protein
MGPESAIITLSQRSKAPAETEKDLVPFLKNIKMLNAEIQGEL